MEQLPAIKRTHNGDCSVCSRSPCVEIEEERFLTNGELMTIRVAYCWLHYRKLVEGIEAVNRFNKKIDDEHAKRQKAMEQSAEKPQDEEIPF